jgi:hypothetical protein
MVATLQRVRHATVNEALVSALASLPRLTFLHCSYPTDPSCVLLPALLASRTLRRLDITLLHGHPTGSWFDPSPILEELRISTPKINPSSRRMILRLQNMPSLTRLSVSGPAVVTTGHDWRALRLTELVVHDITGADMLMRGAPSLTSVVATEWPDRAWSNLAHCSDLRSLRIATCESVPPISAISALSHLALPRSAIPADFSSNSLRTFTMIDWSSRDDHNHTPFHLPVCAAHALQAMLKRCPALSYVTRDSRNRNLTSVLSRTAVAAHSLPAICPCDACKVCASCHKQPCECPV